MTMQYVILQPLKPIQSRYKISEIIIVTQLNRPQKIVEQLKGLNKSSYNFGPSRFLLLPLGTLVLDFQVLEGSNARVSQLVVRIKNAFVFSLTPEKDFKIVASVRLEDIPILYLRAKHQRQKLGWLDKFSEWPASTFLQASRQQRFMALEFSCSLTDTTFALNLRRSHFVWTWAFLSLQQVVLPTKEVGQGAELSLPQKAETTRMAPEAQVTVPL